MAIEPEVLVDPVSLEIFRSALTAIAEEMGAVLTRSGYSPNIKERRDFSCALFDRQGRLLAQAAHIPVHLGAMPDSVAAALAAFDTFAPGDVVALNDPFAGGTHLPDITLISPIYVTVDGESVLAGFAANRAHHADVGGMSAGSMPVASEIYQEGIIIPPIKLWEAGQPNRAALALLLRNVRTPDERRGDLTAQVAANRTAERRLQELVERYGLPTVEAHGEALIAYAERITRATIEQIPDGVYRFTDYLDDDGINGRPLPIVATVTVEGGTMTVDFSGSAPEAEGSINAVASVAKSAVYYVVRCLMPPDAPMNHGTFAPVTVHAPEGTVVNARPPRPVAGGNVECSQRITDAVLGALAQALPERVPAASHGSMNNLAMGARGATNSWDYYETVGGGMGAGSQGGGLSAVQTHMTNTRNTPIEALEMRFPVRIRRYGIRRGSGGAGRHRGGDGLVREFEFLAPATVTLLTERRRHAPWGLAGGHSGAPGENHVRGQRMPPKATFEVQAGDRLVVETPGGGGWGGPKAGAE